MCKKPATALVRVHKMNLELSHRGVVIEEAKPNSEFSEVGAIFPAVIFKGRITGARTNRAIRSPGLIQSVPTGTTLFFGRKKTGNSSIATSRPSKVQTFFDLPLEEEHHFS